MGQIGSVACHGADDATSIDRIANAFQPPVENQPLAWTPEGPTLEVWRNGAWVSADVLIPRPAAFQPVAGGRGKDGLAVVQKQSDGDLWADLEPQESLLVCLARGPIHYRLGGVLCWADIKAFRWKRAGLSGSLRFRPAPLGALAKWISKTSPDSPVHEAAALASWCETRLTADARLWDSALLHHYESYVNAAKPDEEDPVAEVDAGKQQVAMLTSTSYAAAFGELLLGPALGGPQAGAALTLLEHHLGILPALCINGMSSESPMISSSLKGAASGLAEACRNQLMKPSEGMGQEESLRVARLLLQLGMQTGSPSHLLWVTSWLLKQGPSVQDKALRMLQPVLDCLHGLNGVDELLVMRDGLADWESRVGTKVQGPALVRASTAFPGRSKLPAAVGVHCTIRLFGDACSDVVVAICPKGPKVATTKLMMRGAVNFGKQKAQSQGEDESQPTTEFFGPRVFQGGDVIELALTEAAAYVAVNGEMWGELPVSLPPGLWQKGACIFVSLPDGKCEAEVDLLPTLPDEFQRACPALTWLAWGRSAGSLRLTEVLEQGSGVQSPVARVLLYCLARNCRSYPGAQKKAKTSTTLTEESHHPYHPSMDQWKEISIPGAEKLSITFDEQCSVETDCDKVGFFDRKNGSHMIGKVNDQPYTSYFTGRTGTQCWQETLEIEGSSFWYHWYTDGSEQDWGFRFTVTATMPSTKSSVPPLSVEEPGSPAVLSAQEGIEYLLENAPPEAMKDMFEVACAHLRLPPEVSDGSSKQTTVRGSSILTKVLQRAAKENDTSPELVESAAAALEESGPQAMGDSLGRLEVLASQFDSKLPGPLSNALGKLALMSTGEGYGSLLGQADKAHPVLARFVKAADEQDRQSEEAGKEATSYSALVLQVLADLISALCMESLPRTEQGWRLVTDISKDILARAEGLLKHAANSSRTAPGRFIGVLAPALLRGLVLAAPCAPDWLLAELLPISQKIKLAASGGGRAEELSAALRVAAANLEVAAGTGLLRRAVAAGKKEEATFKALSCELIRRVPKAALGSIWSQTNLMLESDQAMATCLGLEDENTGEEAASSCVPAAMEEFIVSGCKSERMLLGMMLPGSMSEVRRCLFVALVMHHGLLESAEKLLDEATAKAMQPSSWKVLRLLWQQASSLVMAMRSKMKADDPSGDAEKLHGTMMERARLVLQSCAWAQSSAVALDDEDSDEETSLQALMLRQALTTDLSSESPQSQSITRSGSGSLKHTVRRSVIVSRATAGLQMAIMPLQKLRDAEERAQRSQQPPAGLQELLLMSFETVCEQVCEQSKAVALVSLALEVLSRAAALGGAEALGALGRAWGFAAELGRRSCVAFAAAKLNAGQRRAALTLASAARAEGSSPVVQGKRALALCSFCLGTWGPPELSLYDEAAADIAASLLPWAPKMAAVMPSSPTGNQAGMTVAPALKDEPHDLVHAAVSASAWLCSTAATAAAHTFTKEAGQARLGRWRQELLSSCPQRPLVPMAVQSPRRITHQLSTAFAPIGGLAREAELDMSGASDSNESRPTLTDASWNFEEGGIECKQIMPNIVRFSPNYEPNSDLCHALHANHYLSHGQHMVEFVVRKIVNRMWFGFTMDDDSAGQKSASDWYSDNSHTCLYYSGTRSEQTVTPIFASGNPTGSWTAVNEGDIVSIIIDLSVTSEPSKAAFSLNGNLQGEMEFNLEDRKVRPMVVLECKGDCVEIRRRVLKPATTDESAPSPEEALGGLGYCAARPLVAWLLSLGWARSRARGAAPDGELLKTVLPVLLNARDLLGAFGPADTNLVVALASVLLEEMAFGEQDVERVLASMEALEPGDARSVMARLLRRWLFTKPAKSEAESEANSALRPLLRRLAQGQPAALEVVAGPDTVRCLSTVSLGVAGEPISESGPVSGVVVAVRPSLLGVVSEGSKEVEWCYDLLAWPLSPSSNISFPEDVVKAVLEACVKGSQGDCGLCPMLQAVLAAVKDARSARLVFETSAFKTLQGLGDCVKWSKPRLPDLWDAIGEMPEPLQLKFCARLQGRQDLRSLLQAAIKRAGQTSREVFADMALRPGLLSLHKASEDEQEEEWLPPSTVEAARLSFDDLDKLVCKLLGNRVLREEWQDLLLDDWESDEEVQDIATKRCGERWVLDGSDEQPGDEECDKLDNALLAKENETTVCVGGVEYVVDFATMRARRGDVAEGESLRLISSANKSSSITCQRWEDVLQRLAGDEGEPADDPEPDANDGQANSREGRQSFAMILQNIGGPEAPETKDDKLSKEQLISALFKALDTSEEGFLSASKFHRFAEADGYDGSDEEWLSEFNDMCNEKGWDKEKGIDRSQFAELMDEREDDTLAELLGKLEPATRYSRGDLLSMVSSLASPAAISVIHQLDISPASKADDEDEGIDMDSEAKEKRHEAELEMHRMLQQLSRPKGMKQIETWERTQLARLACANALSHADSLSPGSLGDPQETSQLLLNLYEMVNTSEVRKWLLPLLSGDKDFRGAVQQSILAELLLSCQAQLQPAVPKSMQDGTVPKLDAALWLLGVALESYDIITDSSMTKQLVSLLLILAKLLDDSKAGRVLDLLGQAFDTDSRGGVAELQLWADVKDELVHLAQSKSGWDSIFGQAAASLCARLAHVLPQQAKLEFQLPKNMECGKDILQSPTGDAVVFLRPNSLCMIGDGQVVQEGIALQAHLTVTGGVQLGVIPEDGSPGDCIAAEIPNGLVPTPVTLTCDMRGKERTCRIRGHSIPEQILTLSADVPRFRFVAIASKTGTGMASFESGAAGAALPKEIVCESDHPYKDYANIWKEIKIPGATSLRISFDKQCRTESGCDYLSFHTKMPTEQEKNSGMLYMAEGIPNEISGDNSNFKDFEFKGNYLVYRFRADHSNTDWGFKFTVSPVGKGGGGGRMKDISTQLADAQMTMSAFAKPESATAPYLGLPKPELQEAVAAWSLAKGKTEAPASNNVSEETKKLWESLQENQLLVFDCGKPECNGIYSVVSEDPPLVYMMSGDNAPVIVQKEESNSWAICPEFGAEVKLYESDNGPLGPWRCAEASESAPKVVDNKTDPSIPESAKSDDDEQGNVTQSALQELLTKRKGKRIEFAENPQELRLPGASKITVKAEAAEEDSEMPGVWLRSSAAGLMSLLSAGQSLQITGESCHLIPAKSGHAWVIDAHGIYDKEDDGTRAQSRPGALALGPTAVLSKKSGDAESAEASSSTRGELFEVVSLAPAEDEPERRFAFGPLVELAALDGNLELGVAPAGDAALFTFPSDDLRQCVAGDKLQVVLALGEGDMPVGAKLLRNRTVISSWELPEEKRDDEENQIEHVTQIVAFVCKDEDDPSNIKVSGFSVDYSNGGNQVFGSSDYEGQEPFLLEQGEYIKAVRGTCSSEGELTSAQFFTSRGRSSAKYGCAKGDEFEFYASSGNQICELDMPGGAFSQINGVQEKPRPALRAVDLAVWAAVKEDGTASGQAVMHLLPRRSSTTEDAIEDPAWARALALSAGTKVSSEFLPGKTFDWCQRDQKSPCGGLVFKNDGVLDATLAGLELRRYRCNAANEVTLDDGSGGNVHRLCFNEDLTGFFCSQNGQRGFLHGSFESPDEAGAPTSWVAKLPDSVKVNWHDYPLVRLDTGSTSWYCDQRGPNCTRDIDGGSVRWSDRQRNVDQCRGCIAHSMTSNTNRFLCIACCASGPAELEQLAGEDLNRFWAAGTEGWSAKSDAQLMDFIEKVVASETEQEGTSEEDAIEKMARGPKTSGPCSKEAWESIGRSAEEAHARFLVLRALNRVLQSSVLPYTSMKQLLATKHGRLLCQLKALILPSIRSTKVNPAGASSSREDLGLVRHLATACKEEKRCDVDGNCMLFAQASANSNNVGCFRNTSQEWEMQPFRVYYEGEDGVDQGGLYRDFFDAIVLELMSPHLPVFVPTANQVTNSGEQRDCWVLNPGLQVASGSPGERMLRFLGRLMGVCLLRGDVLPLHVSQVTWKLLAGESLGVADLEAMDVSAARTVEMMRDLASFGIDQDSFSASLGDMKFTYEDSAQRQRPLLPGGESRAVSFESASEYAELLLSCRLNESQAQIKCLKEGLLEVADASCIGLWTWQLLEQRVVGCAEIDVALLRRKTIYEGFDESEPIVGQFWSIMDKLDQEDLTKFIRFVWGRSRLPPESSSKWGPGFKLAASGESAESLPLAHTCFFQMDLPRYPNAQVMKEKILLAIRNCLSMGNA